MNTQLETDKNERKSINHSYTMKRFSDRVLTIPEIFVHRSDEIVSLISDNVLNQAGFFFNGNELSIEWVDQSNYVLSINIDNLMRIDASYVTFNTNENKFLENVTPEETVQLINNILNRE